MTRTLTEDAGTGDFRTLPQRVAEELRHRIVVGDLPPGAHLPERETSAELGVSRTPLREALRILANEGLVEIRPARSPVVANPSVDDLDKMFAVLRALEALAGEQACLNASDAEIDAIATVHARLRALAGGSPPAEFFETDMAFHSGIVAATGNAALIKTHAEYNARLRRARFLVSRVATDRARIIHEHGEVLNALVARDTRWAAAMLDTHLRSARHKLIELPARVAAGQ